MSSKNAAVSHEYCQGYVDKNNVWNNGFYCRKWGGQEGTYCCGDGKDRFCCPEVPHLITPTVENYSTPTNSFNYIPLIIGICVVVVVVFIAVTTILLSCLLCPCCPAKKRQRFRQRSSSFVLTGTFPVCTEAEATSSVIAAEALQLPYREFTLCPSNRCGGQSPSPSQDNRHGYGDTGSRPWSPNTSHCTMDDFDSINTGSLYRRHDIIDLPWNPAELQNLCNCNCRPSLKLEPKIRDTAILINSSGTNVSFSQSVGIPSSLRLDPFGAKRSCMTDSAESTTFTKPTTLELSRPRPSPFRSGAIVMSTAQERPQFRFPASLVTETDRHKRDSGVLVEEPDASDNSGSLYGVGISAPDDQMNIVQTPPTKNVYPWNNS